MSGGELTSVISVDQEVLNRRIFFSSVNNHTFWL